MLRQSFDLDQLLEGVTPENTHGEVGMESAEVVRLHPVEVGDGYRFDPDELLDKAKGQDFTSLVIIAQQPDGELWVSSMENAGASLILLEKAKHFIVFGE